MKRTFLSIIISLLCLSTLCAASGTAPKREFRGAWLHVIGQTQYMGMGTKAAQDYLRDQLDKLQAAGCNAVIFQVRPTADAMYKSDLEPWTAWLTGARGKAPDPMWDPLEFMVKEAHARGMELHAWLNPYRVTSNPKEVLPASHMANKEPQRFVKFNGQTFFDPAYPENRDYISEVVADIVRRYDVDAIHIDDYFYPYPANGKRFEADDKSYAQFGNGEPRNDWRRHNVNLLIEQLHSTIRTEKPWVRFGVSPFGIWRNRKNDARGSESNGLQNYDDLYADVLLWSEEGWVDYLVPQLYWELDLQVAPSRKLAKWWNDNVKGSQLYFGWDTKRTMDKADPQGRQASELKTKVGLSRDLPNAQGNVWWHGYWVTGNYKGVADSLASVHQSSIALPPAWGDPNVRPRKPEGLKLAKEDGNMFLEWKPAQHDARQKETDVVRYVVYEYFPGEKPDISDPQTIIALTPYNRVLLCSEKEWEKGITLGVTALDRMNRESEPAWLKQ